MMAHWLTPLVLLAVTPAWANDGQLCRALQDLRKESAVSGPQRIAIFKEEEMTFACGRNKSVTAQSAFCDAAATEVGLEFTHKFPWLVYDCLRVESIRPQLQKIDQYTGINRKKVVHLRAKWPDGTAIEVAFEPSGDFGPQPRFKDYWGAYKLVVWRPS